MKPHTHTGWHIEEDAPALAGHLDHDHDGATGDRDADLEKHRRDHPALLRDVERSTSDR